MNNIKNKDRSPTIKKKPHPVTTDLVQNEASKPGLHLPDVKVTSAKKAAEEISSSEVKLRLIMNASLDAVICIDIKGDIIFWNLQAQVLFGWPETEVLGKPLAELIIPVQYRKRHNDGISEYLRTGKGPALNKLLELSAIKQTGEEFPIELTIMPIKQKGEEFFCAFIRDITERRSSETALQKAYEEKNTVLESIDDGFFALDTNSVVTYWNKKAEILLDTKKEDLIGKNLHEVFIVRGSRIFYDHYVKALREKITIQFEGFSSLSKKWFAVSAYGSDNGLSVYFKDITEQKNAAEKIKESELRYRSLIEQATDTICIIDASGRFIEMNPSGCQMFGYLREEIMQLFMTDVFFEEDLKADPLRIDDLKAGKTTRNERRIKRKDGTAGEIELSAKMIEDGRIIAFARDITERKKAENKLKESELRYRSIIEQATDAICIADASMKIMDINPYGCQMLGYTREEFFLLTVSDLFLPEDLKANPFKIEELKTGKIIRNERRFIKKDGTLIEVEMSGRILEDGRFIIFGHDIAERKESERLIKESEVKYRAFFESSMDGILLTVTDGKILSANPAACEIFKMTEKEICAAGRFGVADLSDPRLYKLIEERQRTGRAKGELTLIRKDGSKFQAELTSAVFTDSYDSNRTSMIVRDITERKEAEDRLKESELRYRSLNEQATDAICITDASMKFININPYACQTFGYTEEEALQLSLPDILFPEDLVDNPIKLSELKLGHTIRNERRLKRKDGTAVDMEVSTKLMEDGRMIMFGHDITARKKAEEKMFKAENRFRVMIEKSTDMKTLSTRDGEIIYGSPSITKVLGYSPEEFYNRSAFGMIHPDDITCYREKREDILQTPGKSFHNQARFLHKNGNWVWCEGIVTNMLHEPGVNAMVSNFRNISEKKTAEQEDEFNRNNLNALINNTNDLMWSIDRDFRLITSNKPFEEMSMINFGKILTKGSSVVDVSHSPEIKKRFKKLYERAFKGEAFTETAHFSIPTEFWSEISYFPIRNGNEIIGTACYSRDITERKRSEINLAESEKRYRQIVETAQEGIWMIDENKQTTFVNKRICEILGYTAAEMLGKDLFHFMDDEGKKISAASLEIQKKSGTHNLDCKFLTKTGTTVWAYLATSSILDEDGSYIGGLAMVTDITERRKIDESNKFKAELLNTVGQSVIATNMAGIVNFWNKAAENTYGWTSEEAIGKNIIDLTPAQQTKEQAEEIMKKLLLGHSWSGEFSVKRKNGINFPAYVTNAPIYDQQHQLAGIIGVSSDITQRKRSEINLALSEKRYRQIVETAQEGIWMIDENSNTTFVNKKMCEILEYTEEEMMGKAIYTFMDEEGKQLAGELMIKKMQGNIGQDHFKYVSKSGKDIWTNISANPLFSEDGIYTGSLAMVTDITEKKHAELLIIASETKYRTLFEQNMAGVYQTTICGKIINCNIAFAKMLKYDSPAELENINASELYFSAAERNDFTRDIIAQKKLNNHESVLKCKDGSPLYFIENISYRKDDITGEEFFYGIMIDITEKKQAELQLKESNVRYNLISQATNDMVWDWDLVTGKVYRNKEGWKKIFRTGDQEIENELIYDWDKRVHPEDEGIVKQVQDEIQVSEKDFFEVECRMLRNDGTYAYIHDRGNIIRNEQGKAIRLIGATQDITARKEAELQVVKSEFRFRSLVQNSSDLITILDERAYYLFCSPAVKKILGYESEFMIGKNAFAFVHPEDTAAIKIDLAKVRTGMYFDVSPFRFKNEKGEWRWLESRITDMRDNPEVNGFVFNSRDVTERKIAEEEIKKLSFIARETGNGVIITNPAGEIVWVNEGFSKITEFEFNEVTGKKPGSFLQGEETNLAVVRYMRNKIKNVEPFECDIINYSKAGKKYWLRIQSQPQFDETGKLKYFFSINTDITKEKEAAEILKASEERYRYLFNNNPASIIIWDIENFQILEVNDTAVGLYEYSKEELITKTVFDLSLSADYNKIKHLASVARQRSEFRSEVTCKHINKAGFEMYMHVSSHLIWFKGRPVILALATDITDKIILENELENERQLKQQEITQAVITAQENERQELGSELHDNINQILAGSRLYLGLAKKELKVEHPYLTETETLITSAISEIRILSHSLIAPSLNESELLGAIDNIIAVTEQTSGIKISLHAPDFDETDMPDKLKLSIFRIIQEQFNNILKHAVAQKVIVRLVQENEKTLLSIKDDGVGFDTNKKPNGVGLLNIRTRASLFNGDLTIISSPGKGCELRVLFN